jgi:hypothetical protein
MEHLTTSRFARYHSFSHLLTNPSVLLSRRAGFLWLQVTSEFERGAIGFGVVQRGCITMALEDDLRKYVAIKLPSVVMYASCTTIYSEEVRQSMTPCHRASLGCSSLRQGGHLKLGLLEWFSRKVAEEMIHRNFFLQPKK